MAESVYGRKIVAEPWIDISFDETVRLDTDNPGGDRLLSPDQVLKLIKELYDALPDYAKTGLVVHDGLTVSIGPLKSTVTQKQAESLHEAAMRPEWADADFLVATNNISGDTVKFVKASFGDNVYVSHSGVNYNEAQLKKSYKDIRKA